MNKGLYISSLVLSFIFICVCGYYIGEVNDARIAAIFESINSIDSLYSGFDSYSSVAADLTEEAGLICVFFFLFFIATDLLGLLKVKTKTTKIFSIIGLCFASLFLLWDVMMISSASAISFDEVGPVFLLYGLLVLAFSIVGIVQSTRFAKRKIVSSNSNETVIDL